MGVPNCANVNFDSTCGCGPGTRHPRISLQALADLETTETARKLSREPSARTARAMVVRTTTDLQDGMIIHRRLNLIEWQCPPTVFLQFNEDDDGSMKDCFIKDQLGPLGAEL